MINYPNKKSEYKQANVKTSANRGQDFEEMINRSNSYYEITNVAFIHKRPTPIKVIKTENNHIVDGVFESKSTLDYVGVYNGKYIDFEAKETNNLKSFPMDNILPHQIEAMKKIIALGGISFVLVYFTRLNRVFLLEAKTIIENSKNKSFLLEDMEKVGHEIKEGYNIPVDYLKIIKTLYF